MSMIECIYGSEACLMAELYREYNAIRTIRHATSLRELQAAFQAAGKAARAEGDTDLLQRLTAAKDKRKKDLEIA